MAHRLLPVTLLATLAAVSACGGGDERAQQVRDTGRAVLPGIGFTSAQLEQALLTETPGYRRAGEPDSGEYGSIRAFKDLEELRDQAVVDPPRCKNGAAGPVGNVDADVPAALTLFNRGDGHTATEALMGLPAAAAERQVMARVPPGCTTFRTKAGSEWAEHRVYETVQGTIGEGSRTVGVATVSGGVLSRTWYVVFKDRHYLGTITVHGPRARRADAERLARQALDRARQILR
ncbi:hypothetical protein [Actinomadura roseirufa]|uniref:hypothetical protein n=1 Tax=Actinomadura roseirufa TaxID=2094049 RepID=UPI0010410FDF|nr:hypothetical protein [Actinomadura roseirufa]